MPLLEKTACVMPDLSAGTRNEPGKQHYSIPSVSYLALAPLLAA